MKSVILVLLSGLSITALAQQQSPFAPPPTGPAPAPPAQPSQPAEPAQPATPPVDTVNPSTPTDPGGGSVTNRSSVPVTVFEGRVGENPTTGPAGTNRNTAAAGAFGANGTAGPVLGGQGMAEGGAQGATAPLFINVSGTAVLDANGQPVGSIQQLVLTPSGSVSLAVVNMGGRLVPVPWQLIGANTAPGRSGLVINAERGMIQRAPPVLMSQLPTLTQDAVIDQIHGHFNLSAPSRSTVGTAATAQGRPGGLGVTITGGATNATGTTSAFATNNVAVGRTNNVGATMTRSNQAVNTSGGLLSPTGRTNAAYDGFNSGPGSTDRLGPRQNANPPQPQPPQRRQ